MKVIDKKNTDIILAVTIFTRKMNKAKFTDFVSCQLKFFTKNSYNNVTCSYSNGVFNNLREDANGDCFAFINSTDLQRLEDGELRYEFSYSLGCSDMADGKFDGTFLFETDFYLESI